MAIEKTLQAILLATSSLLAEIEIRLYTESLFYVSIYKLCKTSQELHRVPLHHFMPNFDQYIQFIKYEHRFNRIQ